MAQIESSPSTGGTDHFKFFVIKNNHSGKVIFPILVNEQGKAIWEPFRMKSLHVKFGETKTIDIREAAGGEIDNGSKVFAGIGVIDAPSSERVWDKRYLLQYLKDSPNHVRGTYSEEEKFSLEHPHNASYITELAVSIVEDPVEAQAFDPPVEAQTFDPPVLAKKSIALSDLDGKNAPTVARFFVALANLISPEI